jgi:protein-disulfide isomerase
MTPADGNTRLTLPVSDRDHIQGERIASVVLVEYGDYQCPLCLQAFAIVREIQLQLTDRLCFVFRHFPCTKVHPYAQHAAEASEAAAAQGKFWDMHDCLFAHQSALDNGHLVEYALAIGLDVNQFLHDMTQDVHVDRVLEDFDSGIQSGVIATPTFFINGIRHQGSWDRATLLAAILSQSRRQ